MEEQNVDRLIKEEMSYGPPIDQAPETPKYPPMQSQREPEYLQTMILKLCIGSLLLGFVLGWFLFAREE